MPHTATLTQRRSIWEDVRIGGVIVAVCSGMVAVAGWQFQDVFEGRSDGFNYWIRGVSVLVVSIAAAWLFGRVSRANALLIVERGTRRERESLHRLIGEIASDFAFHARIESDGRILIDSATGGLSALIGYTLDELQHRSGLTIIHADDRAGFQAALSQAGAGEQVRGEARVVAKNGRLVHVEYRAQPARAADGHPSGVLGAFRDVTVHREQQAALDAERQRLLGDIAKRRQVEAELRQATIEAEKRADEAEEARAALKDQEYRLHHEAQLKDEFLATLAHELRNPLAPLRNVAEIFRLEPLSPTARQATGVMNRQIAQLVRLIDDLMDVSRITRGHLALQRSRVDLRTIIASAVETAQPQLTGAGVSLTVETPPTPCLLNADATRIAQILLNLLNNAAKFTPAGGRVWVTAVPNADRVHVVVRDSGIGIAADDQERVFGMFVQLNRDPRRTQTGLGIGLTLVKQMAELHGGTVAVWSAGIGEGSEFTVTLPNAPDLAELQPVEAAAPRRRKSQRILVTDDSRDGADSLACLLRAAGHHVHAAYDGRTAIEMADRLRPDVMLLDIGMPEVSGYDVARAIRREAWGRHMRLIALTGWGQAEHRRRSLEIGFDEHLVKPVELGVLENVLELGSRQPNSGTTQPIA